MTDPAEAQRVLGLPLRENDAEATTVRAYLVALLAAVWREGEDFSGKRPFGNSNWEYDLYRALAAAGLVAMTVDDDGYVDEFDQPNRCKADALIAAAITEMGTAPHD